MPSGVVWFTSALADRYGLTEEQTRRVATALREAPADGRAVLARIALAWAPGEAGVSIPSRLVLSGHSSAGLLWGQHASFGYASLRALAEALPRAARQVEDVHISGCFTEREVQRSAEWVRAFPGLKTLWGYREYCPSTPTAHLLDWESVTRGRASKIGESFMASHASATAWSVTGGIANASLPVAERRALVAEANGRFESYFDGTRRILHAHQPDADRDYAAYQMLAAAPDATPSERATASSRAAELLRLRFYEQRVRIEFAQSYGPAAGAALARLGLPPADFARLSRKDALALVALAVERAPAYPDPATRRGLALLVGLRDLRSDVITERFCR
jgi:hypothetical protein